MANRCVFSNQNNYSKLEEALESILAGEDQDIEYDVVLLPPDPATVIDEEEGNEDDLISSTLPRDVPGTLEVIHRHPDYDVSNWNDSDDEPLSNTAGTAEHSRNKRPRNQREQPEVLVWRKTLPQYSAVYDTTDT
ncbi:unnamed protein product [Parnassius apollo]|uniref:(apollo) hypothetical protein n=1 Tax=Parnassius apollo TaxID=110799 RepID=A0A8S3WG55_PARAO|nr:unnamed protein product [Parnassius apollo]